MGRERVHGVTLDQATAAFLVRDFCEHVIANARQAVPGKTLEQYCVDKAADLKEVKEELARVAIEMHARGALGERRIVVQRAGR